MATAGTQPAATAPREPAILAKPMPIPTVTLRPEQIGAMVRTLREAPQHGFGADEFAPANLDEMLRSPDPAARTRGATLLEVAILNYARAQRGGRIREWPVEWSIRPEPYDPTQDFLDAVNGGKVDAWLASLPPPFEGYRALKEALVRYQAIAARGGWGEIPDGPALQAGSKGARVRQLRQRLAVEDGAQAADGPGAAVFDDQLADAVRNFQGRHGLTETGVVGPETLAALNVSVEQRLTQLGLNMERWRWMPRTRPATRIEVNVPAADLFVYQNGKTVLTMKAVAGRPTDRTPMLASAIHSIVFNPTWHIPTSIATKEILPKARRSPGYLAAHGYVLRKVGEPGHETVQIQQKPGPKNALGQIKFDFDNRFGVYLHDTSAKSAFNRQSRDVSHGCVRVEKPRDLAALLLQDNPEWSPDRISETIDQGDTMRVKLQQPMPVYLLYWTSFVDASGDINFRSDFYDWDPLLLQLLDAGRRPA